MNDKIHIESESAEPFRPVTLALPAKYIAALMVFAAKDDVVFKGISGLFVEINSTAIHLVTSDGAMAGCFRVPHDDKDLPNISVIIPAHMLKSVRTTGSVYLTIGDMVGPADEYSRHLTMEYGGKTIVGQSVERRYPNYRCALPKSVSGEPAQYSPSKVALIAKAWSVLYGRNSVCYAPISCNGESCAIFRLNDLNFAGGIMPMNIKPETNEMPQWVFAQ